MTNAQNVNFINILCTPFCTKVLNLYSLSLITVFFVIFCQRNYIAKAASKMLMKWGAYTFSSLFILDVATLSQKDHKLFITTYNLCSKKIIGNKKIEGSPLNTGVLFQWPLNSFDLM